jgi:tripartite motif-containing protein 2/3
MDVTEKCSRGNECGSGSMMVNPRTLPCLHSFCSQCLADLLTKQSSDTTTSFHNNGGNGGGGSQCPKCATIFEVPKEGVSGLPVDPFVLGLVQQKEATANINPNDVKCDCGDEPALIHCPNCELFFGEKCSQVHGRSKANKSHSVVTVDDYFSGSGPTTRVIFCQTHPALEIDTFCKTCDQPMCPSCIVPIHNSHNLMKLKDISLDFTGEILKSLKPVMS